MGRSGVLKELSDALAGQAEAARHCVVEIRAGHGSFRSGTLWRSGVVVTSEQSLPKAESYEVVTSVAGVVRATLKGRDTGTNVAVLALDAPTSGTLPAVALPQPAALALAFGADGYGGVAARLGIVSALAPEWRSRAGGRIDRRILLDITLSHREEGGPVFDAAGSLLGMSTLGHRDSVLVIPPSTIERSVETLLAHGRVERGWLGVALQPVAIPDAWRETAEGEHGLMVISTVADGPAAKAGILAGDILVKIGGGSASRVHHLAEQLGPDSVGHALEVSVVRGGAVVPLRATIAARPEHG